MEIDNLLVDNHSIELKDKSKSKACICLKKVVPILVAGTVSTAAFVLTSVFVASVMTLVMAIACVIFIKVCVSTPKVLVHKNPEVQNSPEFHENPEVKKNIIRSEWRSSSSTDWFGTQDIQDYESYLMKKYEGVEILNPGHHDDIDRSLFLMRLRLTGEILLDTNQELICLDPKSCKNSDECFCSDLYYNGGQRNSSIKKIAVVFHVGVHWILIFADIDKKTIEWYDSFACDRQNVTKSLNKVAEQTGFEVQKKMHKKLQYDSYQCGPWALYFLENRLKTPEVDFNKLDPNKMKNTIIEYRKHISQVIKTSN